MRVFRIEDFLFRRCGPRQSIPEWILRRSMCCIFFSELILCWSYIALKLTTLKNGSIFRNCLLVLEICRKWGQNDSFSAWVLTWACVLCRPAEARASPELRGFNHTAVSPAHTRSWGLCQFLTALAVSARPVSSAIACRVRRAIVGSAKELLWAALKS